MKVVASMMAGTKERIMVLQVGEEQHLIGVTANTINHLATLQENIDTTPQQVSQNTDGFKQKLVEAMASRIQNKTGVQRED